MRRFDLSGTRARISGGFGIVLVLFLAVSLIDLRGQAELVDRFESLDAVAIESIVVTDLKNRLADIDLAIRDYLLRDDAENRKQVADRYSDFKTALEGARADILHEERRALIASIAGIGQSYWSAFLAVTGPTERKQHILSSVIDPMATRLRDRLTAIQAADTSADRRIGMLAVTAAERLLAVHHRIGRFLATVLPEDADKAKAEWDTFQAVVGELDKAVGTDEGAKRQVSMVKAFVPTYGAALGDIKAVLADRETRLSEVWRLGREIRAVVDRIRQSTAVDQGRLSRETADAIAINRVIAVAMTTVGLVLGVAFAFLTIVALTRPIVALTLAMRMLAEGDTARDIPGRDRPDELGAMARSVQVFRDAMIERETLESAGAEERAAKEQRALALERSIHGFEGAVGGLIDSVGAAAERLSDTARGMAEIAEETSRLAGETAQVVEETACNVRSVADNTEHLTLSITEIARQSSRSSDMTRDAVDRAGRTDATFDALSGAARRIGDIVKLITGVASQTNLLALNATIEAARAGEAGRGFSVVASEVKALAHQTAAATEDISAQVSSMWSVTEGAVEAIRDITASISAISETTTAIAATVEEQHAAADTIARSVRLAAGETDRVAANVAAVHAAADRSGHTAGSLLGAAENLAGQATALRAEIQLFLTSIRAA